MKNWGVRWLFMMSRPAPYPCAASVVYTVTDIALELVYTLLPLSEPCVKRCVWLFLISYISISSILLIPVFLFCVVSPAGHANAHSKEAQLFLVLGNTV